MIEEGRRDAFVPQNSNWKLETGTIYVTEFFQMDVVYLTSPGHLGRELLYDPRSPHFVLLFSQSKLQFQHKTIQKQNKFSIIYE